MRARTGLRIEETARLADEVDGSIRADDSADEVQTIIDNLGLPYSGINLSYSNSGTFGTADARNPGAVAAESRANRPNTSTNAAQAAAASSPACSFSSSRPIS